MQATSKRSEERTGDDASTASLCVEPQMAPGGSTGPEPSLHEGVAGQSMTRLLRTWVRTKSTKHKVGTSPELPPLPFQTQEDFVFEKLVTGQIPPGGT